MDFRTLRSKCALLVTVCVLGMGAAGNAAAQTITLEWDQSNTASVGYRVHVGTASGSYSQHFDVGAATLFAFNTAVAGQRYCFAVSAYLLSSQLDGPNSAEVCGYSDAPPTLQNPGSRTSTVGQPVTLQLVGSDPQSQPLTYSATGLPPGLSVMASTGYISGTGTTAGTYNVTARANDGSLTATQQFTWVMNTATGGGDATRPVATITTPTSNASYTSTTATMNLGGTATDNVAVTQIRWSNDRGGNGTATGTTTWGAAGIPLQTGTNVITVTALDAAGNSGTDSLTVTYAETTPAPTTPPATSTVTLTAVLPDSTTRLSWTDGKWRTGVDIYRNGVRIATVGNNGTARDPLPGPGRYDYVICAGGTTTCSNTATVSYASSTTPSDTTRPTISIVTPTTGTLYTTATASLNLTGSAADNVGVTQVRWSSDRGGSGIASGTTNWGAAGIPLQSGTNVITVTAFDAAGNTGTDSLTVSYTVTTPPPTTPPPTSTVTLTAVLPDSTTRLSWTDGKWRTGVDIYRNGVRIATVGNNGTARDPLPGPGRYDYVICAGGTTTCSNVATVSY
jgi:hypothetical protein